MKKNIFGQEIDPVLEKKIQKILNNFDCQSEHEMRKKCKRPCEHCILYYRPLNIEHQTDRLLALFKKEKKKLLKTKKNANNKNNN